ncbi:hypothetical protein MNAB215_2028 [Mycobacterium numidiamassiliense]|jgi:hypothetical protein|uniref:Transmembrane protein n=1 Tax=Mycobacterium numidiamassiliense TaxID=1841861 RepID=A0A2U3P836_9MYCO|nr:hypothetical protein [Mycobacterium numidiamassiliense]SPM39835.1 hypothetical protein MNAB215_2028 [Mycobacterium numidiamassiliense]
MLQTTNSEHRGSPVGEVVWIAAGIIMLMAFGDALVVLALAFAIAAMAGIWWVNHAASQRAQRNDAQLAPVTQLRARLTHHTPADARGPRAA